jgi:hypothetical protein
MMNTLDCGSVVIAEHGKYEESINQREEAWCQWKSSWAALESQPDYGHR